MRRRVCIEIGIRLPHEMEMGTWARCVTTGIVTHGPLQGREVEQGQLKHGRNALSVVCRCRLSFPVENPAIWPEIEERELRGTKRRLVRLRIADRLHMFAIILQLDLVLRERDGLLLNPERALIDPDRHLRLRQAPLPIELPVLEAQKSMLIQTPDIPGREQNAAE